MTDPTRGPSRTDRPTSEPMRRRQVLRRLCLGAVIALAGCGSDDGGSRRSSSTHTDPPATTSGRDRTTAPTGTPTVTLTDTHGADERCAGADHEDVTDHGAAGDGSTDDTQAIRDAADSAGPSGMVYFPAGTYLIGTDSYTPLNNPGDGSWDGITWAGAGYDVSTVKMAGGHDSRYYTGWRFGEGPVTDGTWMQLTLDGNKSANTNDNSACVYTQGNDRGTFEFVDCVVKNWRGGGLNFKGGTSDLVVRHCTFKDQGRANGAGGAHDINTNMDEPSTVTIEYTHFTGTAGASVDVGDDSSNDYMTVQADWCLFEGMRNGIKLDPENDTTTINNCHFNGGSYTTLSGVKANNSNYNCGSVVMNDCLVEGGTWPGVYVASHDFDELQLRNVVVRDVDNGDNVGAGVYARNATVEVGDLSVRDVGPDHATDPVRFVDCSGAIRHLTYTGTSPPYFEFRSESSNPERRIHGDGDRSPRSPALNWELSDVFLSTLTRNVSLSPEVVDPSAVGPVSHCPAEE